MNEQAQNIAIAEACGWKTMTYQEAQAFDHTIVKFAGWDDEETSLVWLSPDLEVFSYDSFRPPSYTTDLNACHEAEKVFGEDADPTRFINYRMLLDELAFEPRTATAAQRAEAFLRTTGKWEDSE